MDIRGAQGKKDKKNRKRMLDYRKVYNLKGKILASTLGIVIISLGIALCRMGNVGVDPFTAMNMGLSEIVGIGFGTFQLIMNAVILTAVFFLDRSQIGIGTVINMVAVGYLIEFFLWVLGDTPFLPGVAGMVLHLVLGTLLFTLGVSMYLKTRMGVSPIDAVAPIAEERLHRPYLVCRLAQDVLVTLIALITGGPIGIFTVVAALGTGPLITMWNKFATLNLYRKFKVLNPQELRREAAV
ncbi:MAG: YitT family protein [Eggerthellaceae bacterium]|nr:YitT family protein [Eggerthellaceae bacterium]